MSDGNKQQPYSLIESRLVAQLQRMSIHDAVYEQCLHFAAKHRVPITSIGINIKLKAAFEKEIYNNGKRFHYELPVPSEMIFWFYCPDYHADKMPDAEWLIIGNHSRLGVVCTL